MVHSVQVEKGKGPMTSNLDLVGQQALQYLEQKHAARERALTRSRSAIRLCANSIRASHRHEFEAATQLVQEAGKLLTDITSDLHNHHDVFYAGFVQDAQKEFAEASTFLALAQNKELPLASELSIAWAPYLNGLGEAVGELRRYVLDQLRRNNVESSEIYLEKMDDIYALLITIDFPDAVTNGLRRTTDATRGILEKTRGDLTVAVGQAQLQRSLLALQQEPQQK